MNQLNETIIPAQVSATINSAAVLARDLFSISAQLIVVGAGAGTLKIQASNDAPVAANAVPTHWNDITSASVVAAGAGSYMILKVDICYQYVRFVYTDTSSGTGTIQVNLKALGA